MFRTKMHLMLCAKQQALVLSKSKLMEKWFFANVTNNSLLARDVVKMDKTVLNVKMDHIYTPTINKVFVDLAILLATVINATRTVVLHAQIAL